MIPRQPHPYIGRQSSGERPTRCRRRDRAIRVRRPDIVEFRGREVDFGRGRELAAALGVDVVFRAGFGGGEGGGDDGALGEGGGGGGGGAGGGDGLVAVGGEVEVGAARVYGLEFFGQGAGRECRPAGSLEVGGEAGGDDC
jgi:hypothetical protein